MRLSQRILCVRQLGHSEAFLIDICAGKSDLQKLVLARWGAAEFQFQRERDNKAHLRDIFFAEQPNERVRRIDKEDFTPGSLVCEQISMHRGQITIDYLFAKLCSK